jgi:hypothetical protein
MRMRVILLISSSRRSRSSRNLLIQRAAEYE